MTGQPNVLLIMTDQQRADALGCAAGWVNTPNLDRIAGEGVRFTNCLTNSPVCVPARLSLAAGLYPHNTGVWNNCGHTMPAETPTWMQTIRRAGYRTSLFGKTHWHPHNGVDLREREHLLSAYGLDDVDETPGPRACCRNRCRMIDQWEQAGLLQAYRDDYAERFRADPTLVRPSPLGVEHYYDTYVGEAATRYLSDYDRDEPWFCWVSFGGPHEPWDAPEPYASMYDPSKMPPALSRFADQGDRASGALDGMPGKSNNAELSPERIAAMRANYAGNVTLIDDQVGKLLEAVERRGELGNTVIAFISDHGEMNGDHGLVYKSQFLDGALRVPLLIRLPWAGAAGHVCERIVELNDIGPTLVEAIDGRIEHQQFAKSLIPLVRDPGAAMGDEALAEVDGELCLVTPEWKFAVNEAGEPYILFDRLRDPDEQYNLAGSPTVAHVEQSLRERMFERLMAAQLRRERQ